MATANKTPAAKQTPIKSGKVVEAGGIRFTKTKTVTVPVLKLMPDAPAYVRVESLMEVSKQVKPKKAGEKDMEPATVMHCTDLVADSECILIVGKMLKSVIEETYPDGAYVGKSFEIVNHGKRGDKAYNSYSLSEVEIEG